MGIIQNIKDAFFILKCSQAIHVLAPHKKQFTDDFCTTYADVLLEYRDKGYSAQEALMSICINILMNFEKFSQSTNIQNRFQHIYLSMDVGMSVTMNTPYSEYAIRFNNALKSLNEITQTQTPNSPIEELGQEVARNIINKPF